MADTLLVGLPNWYEGEEVCANFWLKSTADAAVKVL